MGKKGTKRKTRWRALPLGEEDGGSGNEEEYLDEDQSTTSSVVGQAQINFRTSPTVYRTSEKPYRQARRFPYDKFRHKEPLIKLESKTFDEEEYTKITTPRQDVLFKKGYFGRKKESSIEENIYSNSTNEVEGEETVMDQIIITNGFVDERGHYLVNGSSYEIYDPYTNTVTVVVGPPPYANGVTPPVLAAVSCQPVPLQPVDWYPPGNEWGPQGPAWTPAYHQNPPHSADSLGSPGQSCESTPTSHGSDGQPPNLYHHPAYIPAHHGFVYEPPVYIANGGTHQDSVNQTTEVMCSNDNSKLKKTRRKSQETVNENEIESNQEDANLSNKDNSQITAIETSKQDSNSSLERIEDNKQEQNGVHSPTTTEEEMDYASREVKRVEKQSHSTQTNLLEAQKVFEKSAEARVKESHSTQTNPDETFPNNTNNNNNIINNHKNNVNNNHNNKFDSTKLREMERNETNRSLSDILLSSLTKKDQEPKVPWKTVNKFQKTSPRRPQEESPKKLYQKRTNFNERNENKQIPSVETSPIKTSYAKKVMNGLENGSIQGNNTTATINNNSNSNNINNNKKLMVNGLNTVTNGSSQFAHNVNVSKTPLTNGTKQGSNEKYNYTENKRNQSNAKINGNVNNHNNKNNNYYERQRFNRSLSNGKSPVAQKDLKEKKIQIPEKQDNQKCLEISSESRSQSEKSSTVSELSSPTELSSGQNTPPEKLIVKKMEQKIANEINKSFEEKLKQNLTMEETAVEKTNEEMKNEEIPEIKEEETINHKNNKQKSTENNKKKKNKNKTEEEKPKETPKSNKSKKKKKPSDDSKDTHDYSNQDIPFLQPFIQQKPNEYLFNGWDKVKNQESDLISDIDSLLTANDDNILKSLGISEDKLNLSKLPLSSGFLKMLPTFNRDRPKFKFDDYFASTSTKQLHSDLCTKTNITNMKSTKPEEFFASIIENPNANDATRGSNSGGGGVSANNNSEKKGAKNGKKEDDIETDKKETVKETNHGAQVIVKKSISIPKTGYKINKNNLKCKMNVTENKSEVKEDVTVKKNEEKPEEVKLGIVEAVNSWLQEEGDSEKLLSVNSLPQSFEKIESDEETEPIQKNGVGNPIIALCVDKTKDEDLSNVNMRVARIENNKSNNTRRFRSSSLDAKLSEKKIKKFLTESASYCHDLIGDVKNGVSLEYAREELCDPKQSVLKYYTLSPALVAKSKKAEESDSGDEVFDVLEYKFLKQERKNRNGVANLSDSGVHSDTELTEEKNRKVDNPSERQPFPNKEVCNCKLQ